MRRLFSLSAKNQRGRITAPGRARVDPMNAAYSEKINWAQNDLDIEAPFNLNKQTNKQTNNK